MSTSLTHVDGNRTINALKPLVAVARKYAVRKPANAVAGTVVGVFAGTFCCYSRTVIAFESGVADTLPIGRSADAVSAA